MSLDDAYRGLAALEFTDAEVGRVLATAKSRRRRRHARVGLAVLAALAAFAAAVSVGSAGFGDAMDRFFEGGRPPGAPIAGDHGDLPAWLGDGEARVLVASRDERVFAHRARSGDVCFYFHGSGTGMCTPYDRKSLFGDEPVVLWGPTHRDERGRWVLWGIALDRVARVELRYAKGPPTEAPSTNGFVLRADPGRAPTSLVAFDRHGRELTAVDVRRRFELAPVGG